MKPWFALIPILALAACSSTAQPPSKKGSAPMTTPSAYVPPLAEGYKPGVPTPLEQGAAKLPYDSNEAIHRVLHIATHIHGQKDLSLDYIERSLGVKLTDPASYTNLLAKKVYLWSTPNWLTYFEYSPANIEKKEGTVFRFRFDYDNAHWAGMPDLGSLRTQMNVAAAEKILLEHGFVLALSPNDRYRDRWWYEKKGVAVVRLVSFGDAPPPSRKDGHIREIILTPVGE